MLSVDYVKRKIPELQELDDEILEEIIQKLYTLIKMLVKED